MQANDEEKDFRALGELLIHISDPANLAELKDIFDKRDGERFRAFIEPFGRQPGKCFSYCVFLRNEVLSAGQIERCALRLDLTHAEWRLYMNISAQHRSTAEDLPASIPGMETLVSKLIPPGPYLDELKAHGLVTCWMEPTTGFGPGPYSSRWCEEICTSSGP